MRFTRLCKPSLRGFTLLEMSIVMVIIALIAGAIMTGKSFIRAGQLRAVITEYDLYVKAVGEFKDKYRALPGDMRNPDTIWPAAAATIGDGNGRIGATIGGALPYEQLQAGETYFAWNHLGLSGLIDGKYTGAGMSPVAGSNVPSSKLEGAAWALTYYLSPAGSPFDWGDHFDHIFMSTGFNADGTFAPTYTTSEAFEIDNKIDDGRPGTGNVRTWRSGISGLCTTESNQANSIYNTINSWLFVDSRPCTLMFKPGF